VAHAHSQHSSEGIRGEAQLRGIRAAFTITVTVLCVEAAGGLLTGSVALLADAGHMLTDAGALGIAMFASWLSLRPRTASKSFGYGRAEILAALGNGLLLGGVSVAIAIESIERLRAPVDIDAVPMIAIACLGLLANLVCAWILARAGSDNLNIRAALAHVIGDAFGSVAAILAGFAVLVAGVRAADAVAGLLIAALLVLSAIRLVRESVDILLEGAPRDLNLEKIASEVAELPGVDGIHDLHIWTVTSGFHAMSGHVDLEAGADPDAVRRAVHQLLHNGYDIAHTTIQTEPPPDLLEIQKDPPPTDAV
jgi:cobalt-zinc-cadmium efflux system protein